MSDPDPSRNAPEQCACDPVELRTLFLFEKLTDEQLAELCRDGHVEVIPPGQVYTEGDPANWFYVLLDGTVVTSRKVGSDDVEITRTDQRGVYGGAFRAYAGERIPQVYSNSMRATVPSRFFVLSAETFARLMHEWFPMAVHLLEGVMIGGQAMREAVDRRERLLALGALSAGLTHELNNPAAAAVRATASLRERISGVRGKLRLIARGPYQRDTLETLTRFQDAAVEKVAKAPKLDPLAAADGEDELCDWLTGNGISNGWEIAPSARSGRPRPGVAGDRPGGGRRADPGACHPLDLLLGRDRAADERDRGRHHPHLDAGGRGPAVLAARPRALPGRRRP